MTAIPSMTVSFATCHCEGCCLRLPVTGALESHTRVRLEGELCCIDMEGEVAHIEGADIGLHCLSLDVESAAKLRRMVELNLVNSALLERNLQQLIAG